MKSQISYEDFDKVDIRMGEVISDEDGNVVLLIPTKKAKIGSKMF